MEVTDNDILTSLMRVQKNIQSTMDELSSLRKEMDEQKIKTEKSRVFKFIDDSKKAGFTEISKMDSYIQKKFSLSADTVASYLFDYIDLVSSLGNQETSAIPLTNVEVTKMESPVCEAPVIQAEPKQRKVLISKKTSDASRIWSSFVKIVQAEMEAENVNEKPKYSDVLKRAKEMKDSDKESYRLFSSTWTPDNYVSSESSC